MNNFQNELQMLNVNDFQANEAIPWDQSQYYVDQDQDRQFGSFFRCFSCFNCFNCSNCFRCSNCFHCSNCFNCSNCHRCSGNCGNCGGGRCAAAVVVAVDKSSFRIENVVDYEKSPYMSYRGFSL